MDDLKVYMNDLTAESSYSAAFNESVTSMIYSIYLKNINLHTEIFNNPEDALEYLKIDNSLTEYFKSEFEQVKPLHMKTKSTFKKQQKVSASRMAKRIWLKENRLSIEAYNEHISKNGVFSDGMRTF